MNLQSDHDLCKQHEQLWHQFLQMIRNVVDPLLYTIFHEANFIGFDQEKNIVHIQILKKFMLFQDVFEEKKVQYQSLLERSFHAKVMLFIDFYKVQEQKQVVAEVVKPITVPGLIKKSVAAKLDLSDKEKWELTHTLLKHFGGTVTQVGKDTHESDA